ncbi:putative fimbrial protein SthD [Providencia rustigianii]|nr:MULTISPECIES: fimbrial protein [Providencia]MTC56401.1 fimbrial protein [Providencia rustigianii]MTC59567.1 fimbrial protein [Providencia rustigianii]SUC25334.1 putative fimbrial protein SthD [Providencia rustigianii]SUC34134.1 putative fimbrial protein SthD [Providencia rustigianii]VEB63195.1 putative fimbrial protein SthD [Providencia rustigianii]
MKRLALALPLLTYSLFTMGEAVKINIFGSVTAMPCEVDNKNYQIDLKKVNIWNIKNTQTSSWVNFSIKLKNCPINTKGAIITLTGTIDPINPDHFINNGTAKNVALNLTTGTNKSLVKNGTKLTVPINSQTHSAEIAFSARMAGYGSGMTTGSFKSHLEFTLSYN